MYDNDDTDPYTDPATGVLRNKLDIADAGELAVVEDHVVTIRLEELYLQPLAGRFDLSQREFLRQLGVKVGYEIRWQEVSAAEMTAASIKGMNGDLSGFEDIFRSIARTLRS